MKEQICYIVFLQLINMVTKAEQFLNPSNVNVFQCIPVSASICPPKHDQESQSWCRNRNKQSGVKILVVKKILSTSKTFSPSFQHRNIHKNQVRHGTRCRRAAKFRISSNHCCCCRAVLQKVVPVSYNDELKSVFALIICLTASARYRAVQQTGLWGSNVLGLGTVCLVWVWVGLRQ